MKLSDSLYKYAFLSMPAGLFIVNNKHCVLAWNDWMVTKTGMTEAEVLGKTLGNLFPEMNYQRFNFGLEQALFYGAPQVLSQILNHYVIPIDLTEDAYTNVDRMQQHVEILPIKHEDNWLALVVVQDVTHSVHQRNVLMQMGHKLEEETYHDALTGIYNRRFLWSHLDRLMAWSKRDSFTIGCVLFDLDHFKKINDQYGHDVGDKVLLFFVNVINKIIRPSDIFVRYGGEEFLLIIPNINQKNAILLANRILNQYEKKSSELLCNETLTCSAGVALWNPIEPYLSAKELIELSDKALYAAKTGGRNCIRAAVQ